MQFEVIIGSAAMSDLRGLRAYDRKAVLDTIERVLTTAPTRVSKSRIKRLRGLNSPQYRLRVDDFRVFYDVLGTEVHVMRILSKAVVATYLQEMDYEVEDDQRRATRDGDEEDRQ